MNVLYTIDRQSLKDKAYANATKVKQGSVTMKRLNHLVSRVLFALLKQSN